MPVGMIEMQRAWYFHMELLLAGLYRKKTLPVAILLFISKFGLRAGRSFFFFFGSKAQGGLVHSI